MNKMPVTQETITRLLPEFEAAVYDPLVDMMFGEITDVNELERARMRIAILPYCREASTAGKDFFVPKLGYCAVRLEMHALPDEHHHFLTVMTHSQRTTPEDIVIDPTYLQYARSREVDELMRTHPRVFVGTRAAIMSLMQGSDFNGAEAAVMYDPSTLSHIS